MSIVRFAKTFFKFKKIFIKLYGYIKIVWRPRTMIRPVLIALMKTHNQKQIKHNQT